MGFLDVWRFRKVGIETLFTSIQVFYGHLSFILVFPSPRRHPLLSNVEPKRSDIVGGGRWSCKVFSLRMDHSHPGKNEYE